MKITRVEAVPFNIPQKEPFRIAMGIIESTMGVLARVYTDEGIMAIGEGAPLAIVTGETQEGALAVINHFITPVLVGEDPFNLERIEGSINETINCNPSAKAAVSMAIYDIVGKAVRARLFRNWCKMVFILLSRFGYSFGLRISLDFLGVSALLEPTEVP